VFLCRYGFCNVWFCECIGIVMCEYVCVCVDL
jgi:hypothetical protein